MRVYVTGASGFLGKHVVRELQARGHEVLYLANGCGFVGDLGSMNCVVHLAARCGGIGRNIAESFHMLRDNLENDVDVIGFTFDDLTRNPPHFIGIGSVCMYPADAPLPLREDDIWNGYPEPTNGPYGIAKRVQLELLRAAHAQYGLPYTFLILANLYGPGDHFDREDAHVIPMLVKRAVEAKESGQPLTVWGDGTPTRDFLYVEDAARAIVAAVEAGPQNQAINIGTGRHWNIAAIAGYLRHIVHLEQPLIFDVDKPKGQQNRSMDISRALALGWEAQTSYCEGLEKTVRWYLDNRQTPALACS